MINIKIAVEMELHDKWSRCRTIENASTRAYMRSAVITAVPHISTAIGTHLLIGGTGKVAARLVDMPAASTQEG